MTNKTKAIVMANKALRAENAALWDENDTLRKGDEELKKIYGAMILQLVLIHGETTLPKIDVKDMMDKHVLNVQHHEDGSVTLSVSEREDDDAECED